MRIKTLSKFENECFMNIVEKRRKLHELIDNSNENTLDTLFLIN